MSSKKCSEWQIAEPKTIPYGHPKRSLKSMVRKVVNTVLSHWAYVCPINSWRVQFHRWRGCHIGQGVYIGRYCFLDNMYPEYIYIYDGASINAQSMILTHFNPFEVWKNVMTAEVKPVVIGENAIVAVRTTIMPGVNIGKYAVIPAGIVLVKNVPDYHVVEQKKSYHMIDISRLMGTKKQ